MPAGVKDVPRLTCGISGLACGIFQFPLAWTDRAPSASELPYTLDMAVKSLTLTLPKALAEEFETLQQDVLLELLRRGLRESKIDRVLDLYAKGKLSFGAAVEQAGVPRSELSRHAYARGLEPVFSDATLAEELG